MRRSSFPAEDISFDPAQLTHNLTGNYAHDASDNSQLATRFLSGSRGVVDNRARDDSDDPREEIQHTESRPMRASQGGPTPPSSPPQSERALSPGLPPPPDHPDPPPPTQGNHDPPPLPPTQTPPAPRTARAARQTKASIKILSQNTRGKRSSSDGSSKFAALHLRVKQEKIAIALLQEAHMSEEEALDHERNYRRLKVLASPIPDYESRRGGVAFLINTELVSQTDIQHTVIVPGRAALLTINWQAGATLSILNIYAPSDSNHQNRIDFFRKIDRFYNENPGTKRPDYMAGDFNMVEEGLDHSSGEDDSPGAIEALAVLKRRFHLTDSFRELYPDTRTPSWRKSGEPETWSRIDRGYLSNALVPYLTTAEILNIGTDSDHLAVVTQIECKEAPFIGPGNWTLKKKLLQSRAINEKVDALLFQARDQLDAIGERSETRNAQLVLHEFKEKVRDVVRAHDKIAQPTRLASQMKDLQEQRRRIVERNDPSSPALAAVDKKILNLQKILDARHKAQLSANQYLNGRRASKLLASQNKPVKTRDHIVRMRKMDGLEAASERDRQHQALRDEQVPNQAPPRPSDSAATEARLNAIRAQTHVTHSHEIAEEIATFHLLLQKQDEPASQEQHTADVERVLGFIKNHLTPAQANTLRAPLSPEAVASTLKKTASDSSPGPDGLTYEFWRHFMKRAETKNREEEASFSPHLLIYAAFRDIEQNGVCEQAHINDGLLCPIHKKGDRDLPQNYRPITLLNTDYKTYTKWRSLLLARVIPKLVPPDQAGFIKGRSIFDNVGLARMVMAHGEATNKNGLLVLLDQEKAYDKVDLSYLWKVVDANGVPIEWSKPIESLYAKATSRVVVNGVISQPFELTRGVRQGDPLSCLLFVLAIEPLAEMLRQSRLKGILTPNEVERLITTLFADDTTVFLDSEDDFATLTEILDSWCLASRARFNIAKTEIIPFGSKDFRARFLRDRRADATHSRIPDNIRIVPDGEAARLLGARVGNELSTDTIWGPTLAKLEQRMAYWSDRDRYPDLHARKMFTDWLPAGMTQFLATCQGMPTTIIDRVVKLQQAFLWKGSPHPTVNRETMFRPKQYGGLGIIDLETRIHAIHVMRLKNWLSGESPPRWAKFAEALIAKKVTQEMAELYDKERRWNPFTQAWRPASKPRLTSHWPPELHAMMETAKSMKISLSVFLPSQTIRRSLPVWAHIGLFPKDMGTRLDLREAMSHANCACLLDNHGIRTVADLEQAAASRSIPMDQVQHEPEENCNCEPCGTEREFCADPIACHADVQTIWRALQNSRWDPSLPDPPVNGQGHINTATATQIDEHNDNGSLTAPRTLLSGPTVAHAIKILAPIPKQGILELADEEEWYAEQTRQFREDCDYDDEGEPETPVYITAEATISHDDVKARFGALIHPDGNELFNIPEEFETRPDAFSIENDPIRVLALAAIAAINKTQWDLPLNIHTTNPKFARLMTRQKKAQEDTDLLDLPSADAWRTLYAKINKRAGNTRITLTHSLPPAAAEETQRAKNAPLKSRNDLVTDPSSAAWSSAGISLVSATQKTVYRRLMKKRTPKERRTSTVNVAMARHAAREQNGSFPSPAAVWASTWSKDLKTNDQELLWKTLHGAYKIGPYWNDIKNFEHRAKCGLCGADSETMEHIIFECDAPGRQEIWDLARQIWDERGAGPWPSGNQFGVLLAAKLMRFERNGRRNKGDERFFCILILTTWRVLWNIRCERAIQGKDITLQEAKSRWWKAMNRRLDLDQATTSTRFDKIATNRATVHHTWHDVLRQDLLPEEDWIGRGTGVLVGSPSLRGEFG